MGHGVPELVLELNGQTWPLDPSRSYSLGRDPQGDLVLDDARVSWRHATIRRAERGWLLEDLGSTNGTFVQGQRVQHADVGPGAVINLGNATDGPRLNFTAPAGAGVGAGAPGVVAGATPAQAAPAAPPVAPQQPAGYPQAPPQQPQPQYQPPQQQPQMYAGQQQGLPQQPGIPPQGPGGWGAPPAQVPPQQAGWGQQPQQPPAQQPQQPQGAPAFHGERSPTTFHQLALGRVMKIGRARENELVVTDLQVSRYHAEFRAHPDGRYEIADLGSHNGTYVNGQPIQRHLLGPNDIVGVGHSTFRLVGDRLEEFVDNGAVSFSARRLSVTVPHGKTTKTILKDVSFGVPEKSLIGVIGPSGSGKSTLLRALTGYRPANQGEVLYDNRNLYKQFAELRQRIGLVPQDDILHKELQVRTALRYAAKLRFPGDTATAEREARIDEVLRELKLDIHADKKVTSLSGGQRKRVSVALELLTKPSLIFLDEPTSGLDPGMDRDVMKLLRGLADDGRTVLVVTHSVAELALCDKLLVMAPGGSVAYFGPPDEALTFFGYDNWADVFSAFENYRDYDWSGRWRGSQHYQTYAAELDQSAPQQAHYIPYQAARPPKPQGWGSQLFTLVRRYLSVILSDRGFIGLMVILPAVLGVVSILIPADNGLGPGKPPLFTNKDAGTILMILAVGACFAGAANSVRELIKERVIYERERAVGLSRSAYLMSKVIVLGLITALQGAIICGIGFAPRKMPTQGVILHSHPGIEMTLVIMVFGFTSMMVGLIISALVKTAEKTMPLLVMFAIVQIVFTGVLFQLYGKPGVEQLSWLMPARWAVAGTGATASLNVLLPWDPTHKTHDALWQHTAHTWTLDVVVLLVMATLCGVVVARLLRRHEPEVMRK
ncbi:FHA modulated ABC efflux pump with fused ATPase and integral membrane subunits [Actinacidiphila yanglinensis]|uniref:FHA modulated ABC efflux pump with fused ATPase and integral membrane subunits n=1 Tax=Actinacidiphila yanglinensis TaxID=310779 RepID=A0A1H5U513_9ACTN|nr:FHA domain-containing protein [Actinacidiphila yanglinensis]SEF70133.1 FHA modulated ABC efflux pump with fused ATPase and integral membrane subunits [Actinacidiphila yanglinensis]